MSMALEHLLRMLSLINLSSVALSVTTGVGGYVWPISVSNILIAAPLLQFTKMAPSSVSVALATMFIMVVNLT